MDEIENTDDPLSHDLRGLIRDPIRRKTYTRADALLASHGDLVVQALRAGNTLKAIAVTICKRLKDSGDEPQEATIRRKLSAFLAEKHPELRKRGRRRRAQPSKRDLITKPQPAIPAVTATAVPAATKKLVKSAAFQEDV